MPTYMGSGIPTSTGFDVSAKRPLDHREVVQSYQDMINIPDIKKYIGMHVYVIDEDVQYKLNKNGEWVTTNSSWSFDSGDPDNNDNIKEGQIYLDIDNGSIYRCEKNQDTGILEWSYISTLKGINGTPGKDGERGSKWFVGNGISGGESVSNQVFPSSGVSSALEKDLFLNKESCDVYVCTTSGGSSQATWSYSCNIKGTGGLQTGNQIYGTPETGTVFENSGIEYAYVGDMYLNTDTGCLYKCVEEGNSSTAKWVYTGSISGGDEIAIQDTEPTDPNIKLWINNETNQSQEKTIPYIEDDSISTEDTWSSSKINTEIQDLKDDINYIMGLADTLSTI